MQIETMMRYPLTPVRRAVNKTIQSQYSVEHACDPSYLANGLEDGKFKASLGKSVRPYLRIKSSKGLQM